MVPTMVTLFILRCGSLLGVGFEKVYLLQNDLNISTSEIISTYLPKPDIIFYLHNSIEQLLKNIARRGRDYEQNISPDYLTDIQASYMNYLRHVTSFPVVIVDTHELDFVKNPADYEFLKSLLDRDFPKGLTTVIPGDEL